MNAFFLFDAARAREGNLSTALEKNKDVVCLYRGRSGETLASVAPYIFSFPHTQDFLDFILQNGWGMSWGVFVYSLVDIEEIFHHFRKFLMVKTEQGKEMYFRFYDPRVLKIFLPTCDKDQLIEFFGPVEKFIAEGDDKETAICFSLQNGVLQQSQVTASSVFGLAPNAVVEEVAPEGRRKKRIIVIDDDLPDPKK